MSGARVIANPIAAAPIILALFIVGIVVFDNIPNKSKMLENAA